MILIQIPSPKVILRNHTHVFTYLFLPLLQREEPRRGHAGHEATEG